MTTGIVFIILTATKFVDGAWIVVLAIPLIVLAFVKINQHYQVVSRTLSTNGLSEEDLVDVANVAIVPMADVHRGTIQALQYAKLIATDVRAVCIATTPEIRERVERRWARFPRLTDDIELVIIDYDYRDILTPVVSYIETASRVEFPGFLITVVIPEFVPSDGYARILHNQTANLIRRQLRNREKVIVIDVPYHIPSVKQLENSRAINEKVNLAKGHANGQAMPVPNDLN